MCSYRIYHTGHCVCVYSVAFFGARYLFSVYSLAALFFQLGKSYNTLATVSNKLGHTQNSTLYVELACRCVVLGLPTKLYTFPMLKKSKYQNTSTDTAGKLSPSVESIRQTEMRERRHTNTPKYTPVYSA